MSEAESGLEQRVARLERELAMVRLQLQSLQSRRSGEAEPEAANEPKPSFAKQWVLGGATGPRATASPSPTTPAEPLSPPEPIEAIDALDDTGAPPAGRPAPPPSVPPIAPPTAPPIVRLPPREVAREPLRRGGRSAEGQSLERRIGGQVFAIAGAFIIIVGLGLAVKLAIDNDWFRFFPPSVRCFGIAMLGAAFLVAGEFLRTRVRAIAVAGCNAVGIGALYIAAYAAFGVFHLIGAPVAFVLMALTAGVGMAVALRHGFLSTAMLSLLGAYLVPVLLAQPDASPYVLPVYVLLLSVVALSLAAVRPRPFGPMRDAAWFGAALLGLAWTFAEVDDQPWLVLAFWALAWVLHQAELLVTALRGDLRPQADGAGGSPARHGIIFRRRVEPVLLAIATTAGVVGLAAVVLKHQLSLDPWLAPAAGLVVTGALALVFGGHLRVLRDKPRTDIEALAAAHAAQAGALLVTTVALSLSGWVEATAWLAMGVAAVVAGRWIAARSLEAYGVVLLIIASVRISTYDLFVGGAGAPWTTDSPLALAPWTVLVIAAGVAWMIVAQLMLHASRDEDGALAAEPRVRAAIACTALAVAAWMFAPAHPESAAAAVCLAWLGLSLALRGVSRVERRLRLGEMGMVASAAAIIPWIVSCNVAQWLHATIAAGTYPGLWLGFAVAAVLVAHAWITRRLDKPTEIGSLWPLLAGLATAVVFAATSMEVARSAAMLADDLTARRAAVSIWWGLWGVSLVVAGFRWRAGPVRYVGLALMSVAALKAVILDMAGVPPLWRVASFVGLGGLMLAVAVLYGRVSASIGSDAPERE